MTNQTTNDKHYECKTCANINSPLCELCTRIDSPSGKERKPKYYIEFSKATSPITQIRFPSGKNKEFKRRAITIARYLCDGKPIPTSVVMKYNELAAKEKVEE